MPAPAPERTHRFKAGQLVRLNSGPNTPTMTVNGAVYGFKYDCQWFAGNSLKAGRFAEESLIEVLGEVPEESAPTK